MKRETYHLTINGRPACEVDAMEPCEFYSSEQAEDQLAKARARHLTSDVKLEPGPCPNTGKR